MLNKYFNEDVTYQIMRYPTGVYYFKRSGMIKEQSQELDKCRNEVSKWKKDFARKKTQLTQTSQGKIFKNN